MRRGYLLLLTGLLLTALLGGCAGSSGQTETAETTEMAAETESETLVSSDTVEDAKVSEDETQDSGMTDVAEETMRIKVEANGNEIVFELNDSQAAKGLYNQLPLTVENKDFSDNEKTFYPPEKLDVSDAPMTDGSIGTLAYYEPWGDVVLFYGSYEPNGALYALGKAVSGQEQIAEISGEMVISPEESTEQKILIAYFTWADNTVVEDQEAAVESAMAHYEAMGDAALYGADAVSSASVVAPGNTARLGEWIRQETGGDLFSIQVKDPYPSDYEECMDRASREDAEDVRPELVGSVEDFSDYDVIFLGFPNWWSSLPMPVLSFVEQYDFSGKTVVPFCAHGTGGLSATVRDLKAALPESAVVLEPLGVYRADIMNAQPKVQEWLKELGFTE